jgi:phosphoenolpyruvate synthase/pyruvate phosphate dikinase
MSLYYEKIESASDPHIFGSKTANTFRLFRSGFCVPDGFGIKLQCFIDFCSQNRISLDGSENSEKAVLNGSFSETIEQELSYLFYCMQCEAAVVRSSAFGEDSDENSCAGIYESVLNIRTLPDFLTAVKLCFSSYFSERANSYRRSHGIAANGMGLLVQKMIDSEKSGLIFTVNPVTCERREMILEAYLGLNFAVVDGIVQADRFILNKNGDILNRDISEKQIKYGLSKNSMELLKQQVKIEVMSKPSLSDKEIQVIYSAAKEISGKFGGEWDIEWTICNSQLYILQARPITAITPLDSFEAKANSVQKRSCDNVTVTLLDRFSVPISTCYSSLLREWQENVYLSFYCKKTGDAIKEKPFVFLYGRVYWNLNFQKIYYDDIPFGNRGSLSIIKKAKLLLLMVQGYRGFYKKISRYDKEIVQLCGNLEGSCSNAKLAELIKADINLFCNYIGKDHFRLLGMAQVCYNLLSEKLRGEENANEFLSTVFELNSDKNLTVQENRKLQQLAQLAADDLEIKYIVCKYDSVSAADLLIKQFADSEFMTEFRSFIKLYGHRGSSCDDIASPHWGEKPEIVMELVRQNLLAGNATEKDKPKDLEFKVNELLAEIGRHCGFFRKKEISFLMKMASTYMVLRENQRFYFDKSWFFLRNVLQKIGNNLYERGELSNQDDIFYFEIQRIYEICSNTDHSGLMDEAQAEKKRLLDFREKAPPYYLFNGKPIQFQKKNKSSFKAVGISAGAASGKIRIVLEISDLQKLENGDIAVVRTFHPSWTPILHIVSGIIMSYGNMLSHGAVVAREYRIPVVVFNGEATDCFTDGQSVKINGTTGRIQLLEPEKNTV